MGIYTSPKMMRLRSISRILLFCTINERCTLMKRDDGSISSIAFMFISDTTGFDDSSV